MRDREVDAAGGQPAMHGVLSGNRRRQLKGNKAEFAVLSNEGPAGPCTHKRLKISACVRRLVVPVWSIDHVPNSCCKHHAAIIKAEV